MLGTFIFFSKNTNYKVIKSKLVIWLRREAGNFAEQNLQTKVYYEFWEQTISIRGQEVCEIRKQ